MIWKLELTSSARREIGRLDPAARRQVEVNLEQLALNPSLGKLLRGQLKGVRSLRSGDDRILYGIWSQDEKRVIYRVAHQREVYR